MLSEREKYAMTRLIKRVSSCCSPSNVIEPDPTLGMSGLDTKDGDEQTSTVTTTSAGRAKDTSSAEKQAFSPGMIGGGTIGLLNGHTDDWGDKSHIRGGLRGAGVGGATELGAAAGTLGGGLLGGGAGAGLGAGIGSLASLIQGKDAGKGAMSGAQAGAMAGVPLGALAGLLKGTTRGFNLGRKHLWDNDEERVRNRKRSQDQNISVNIDPSMLRAHELGKQAAASCEIKKTVGETSKVGHGVLERTPSVPTTSPSRKVKTLRRGTFAKR